MIVGARRWLLPMAVVLGRRMAALLGSTRASRLLSAALLHGRLAAPLLRHRLRPVYDGRRLDVMVGRQRMIHGYNRRASVIHRSKVSAVRFRRLGVPHLGCHRRRMLLV